MSVCANCSVGTGPPVSSACCREREREGERERERGRERERERGREGEREELEAGKRKQIYS